MRILELGNYIVPAYAGMILQEQGHEIEKWIKGDTDPIHALNDGHKLWEWLQEGKEIREQHFRDIESHLICFDAVIDNVKKSTWHRYGIDPGYLAWKHKVRWVSMRSETKDETSFDILAQARSWMEYTSWAPFYVGDTTGGLWLAFKLLADSEPGHFPIYHASVMQKMVEGELIHTPERKKNQTPWDKEGEYQADDKEATVIYKDKTYREEIRDTEWKRENLHHKDGRIIV
jgi:hypothetical protein